MKHLLWLVCAVIGALTGALAGDRKAALFKAPAALDTSVWHVVVPEMTADVKTVDSGRGSFVRGEALVFGEYAFGRADRLIPQGAPEIEVVELELAEDSGPIEMVWQGPTHSMGLRATPHTVGTAGDQYWPREPGVLRLERVDGRIRSGDIDLGSGGPGSIELTSMGGAKVTAVRAWGEDGLVLDVDYRTGSGGGWLPGAVLGGLVGLLFAATTRSRGGVVAGALSLLAPLAVLTLDHHDYVDLVERFYLDTKAWTLAPPLLAASLMPLTAVAWGVLIQPGHRDRRRPWWWVQGGLALAVALIASRDLAGAQLAWVVPGALVLAMPSLLAWRGRLPVAWILGGDLPGLVLVAVLGWSALFPALVIRMVVVLAALPRLVRTAQRPTADHLFATALLALLAAETSLRSAVGDGWDDIGETQLRVGELEPFWRDSCGEGDTSVVFAGGSSTGGAYQFLNEPEAFYPTAAHRWLCNDHALTTWNYGHGGRNSHVLAQAIEPLLDYTSADVVVLYVGVNDLLTSHSTLTRRERDARSGGGVSWVRHSRALTFLGLALRRSDAEDGERVSDVPLADAEDNLRTIAAAAAARDAQVVLVPQFIARTIEDQMEPYWAMEQALADELDHVHLADVRTEVQRAPQPLLDTNHLSRAGNNALGDALAARVAPLLD